MTCGVSDRVEVDANKVTDKVSAVQLAAPEPCAKTTTGLLVTSQKTVPSVDYQLRFPRSLDWAAELVFHTATSANSGGATA